MESRQAVDDWPLLISSSGALIVVDLPVQFTLLEGLSSSAASGRQEIQTRKRMTRESKFLLTAFLKHQ
jgi:hypothetical protein